MEIAKKAGRPKLSAEQRRTRRMEVRLTDREYIELMLAMPDEYHQNKSLWIRDVLLRTLRGEAS
jgi:hypothetical protein